MLKNIIIDHIFIIYKSTSMAVIGAYIYNDKYNMIASHEEETSLITPIMKSNIDRLILMLPKNSSKIIEDSSNNVYYGYKSNCNMICICLAKNAMRTRILNNCIDDISKIVVLTPQNIKKIVNKYNDPSNDKLTSLDNEIDAVTNIMMDNMEKILHRGDNLDALHDKSMTLSEQAQTFNSRSSSLKRNLCMKNAKLYALVALFVSCFIGVIVLIFVYSSKK